MAPAVNREKIITIVIGLSAGVLAAGGYFAFQKFLPAIGKTPDQIFTKPQPQIAATSAAQPEVSGATGLALSLDQINDNISTSEANLSVSGKTVPVASVVVFSNADEKIASADASGNFKTTIKLEEGENNLSVTAFANQTNSAVIRRNVTLEIAQ
ncbi:hypothetical protein M1403_00195 [Patescibacteria group bacterium]|nr:hypothetical protein [Patescibacteria group bacterium]